MEGRLNSTLPEKYCCMKSGSSLAGTFSAVIFDELCNADKL
jgi:hypothetical protein